MKKQIVAVHGGDNFNTYEEYMAFLKSFEIDDLGYFTERGWKSNLQEKLGENFQVILPEMPNPLNARYLEWKIWFDKLVPLLDPEIILVGHSLGGIFLSKYLSENNIQKKVLGTFLVAAPYDTSDADYTLADFILPASLEKFSSQGGKIFLYHSKDDKQVPFVDLEKYKKQLPNATARVFADRGHFNQEDFPEIVSDIVSL